MPETTVFIVVSGANTGVVLPHVAETTSFIVVSGTWGDEDKQAKEKTNTSRQISIFFLFKEPKEVERGGEENKEDQKKKKNKKKRRRQRKKKEKKKEETEEEEKEEEEEEEEEKEENKKKEKWRIITIRKMTKGKEEDNK